LFGLGKVGICFITILAGCYFLNQPVNADIHIPTRPYHPDIIYLGRSSAYELGDHPSKADDPASRYIYALVLDLFGKIVKGILSFTIDNKTFHTISMKLISGIPENGTWRAGIPNLKLNIPYNVLYNVSFKDDLNYSITKSGPYYNHLDYFGNDENIATGRGYNVTDRYILPSNPVKNDVPTRFAHFTAIVSESKNTPLYIATLHYQYPENVYKHNWYTISLKRNQSGIYEAAVPIPFSPHHWIRYFATMRDANGYIQSSPLDWWSPTFMDPKTNKVMVKVWFRTNPSNAGHIICNDTNEYEPNFPIYLDIGTRCTDDANSNFLFNSWSGNVADYLKDTSANTYVSRNGNLTANFVSSPLNNLLKDYLQGLNSLVFAIVLPAIAGSILSWLVPFVVDRREKKNQRRSLAKYMNEIDEVYLQASKKEMGSSGLFDILDKKRIELEQPLKEGKISEDQFEILNDKISQYENEAKNHDKQ
jgi:hypothetical protein